MMSGMTQTPVATFKNREIRLRVPNGAQVLVWNRVMKQFNQIAAELDELPEGEKPTGDMAERHRKAINRLSDVVFGLLDDEADAEWLEDEILEDRIVDSDLLDLFTEFGNAVENADSASGGEQVSKPAKRSAATRVKK